MLLLRVADVRGEDCDEDLDLGGAFLTVRDRVVTTMFRKERWWMKEDKRTTASHRDIGITGGSVGIQARVPCARD